LLCDHNSNSSFGFVLNNYLTVDLHEIDHQFPDIKARISIGGPVDTQNLYYVHTFKEPVEESVKIRDGLFFGGSFETIKLLLEKDNSNRNYIRFFLGYAGWDDGKLNNEVEENSWIVVDNISNKELLNTSNNRLWQYCLEKQGGPYKTISKFPLNPSNN
jgi:putative transcriptional regulator